MDREARAIVRPSEAFQRFTYQAWRPDTPVDRVVNRFWRTAWDLPEPFTQTIVTHPAVNVVVQADASITVTGVQRRNDERLLSGAGWALGALFRPGGFRAVLDVPMSELLDSRMPGREVFGPDADRLAQAVVEAPSVEQLSRCSPRTSPPASPQRRHPVDDSPTSSSGPAPRSPR